MKKSSLSAREYLDQVPNDEDIRQKDGGLYIHNRALEKALDYFTWSTQNFKWEMYKAGYGLGVAASIELLLSFIDDDGTFTTRSFVGVCNLDISTAPGGHFLATAKSLCIANAASEAGPRLGRGLNGEEDRHAERAAVPYLPAEKRKPDSKIMKQFLAAVEAGDQATITLLSNIYEIKIEENGNPT